jgi:hypothetical protein
MMVLVQETHHYGQTGSMKIDQIVMLDLQQVERSRTSKVCPYNGLVK